jgi:hypothetical protein
MVCVQKEVATGVTRYIGLSPRYEIPQKWDVLRVTRYSILHE